MKRLAASLESSPQTSIIDSPIARFLFADTRFAWFWLVVRVWLGWSWVDAGWHKMQSAAWMGDGSALRAFWERAVVVDPRPVAAFDWYRSFLQLLINVEAYTWFGKVVAVGETAIGIALILGAFTGIAAFFGGFLNFNFIMAGTASTNALLFVFATWLVLAWKTAGWIGLDRWLLGSLGTPWRPGNLVRREKPTRPDRRLARVA
jgi:thiosulfate dehydrogenase [quinone] large subunit